VDAVELLDDKTIYLAGTVNGGGSVADIAGSAVDQDAFVVRLFDDGSVSGQVTGRLFRVGQLQFVSGLAVSSNHVVVVGQSQGGNSSDPCFPSTAVSNKSDAFVLWVAPDLNSCLQQALLFGTSDEDDVAVAADFVGPDEVVVVGSYFVDAGTFSLGALTLGSQPGGSGDDSNLFITRMTAGSTPSWAIALQGGDQQIHRRDAVFDVVASGAGDIYFSGTHAGTSVERDSGSGFVQVTSALDVSTDTHPFLAKLDSNGDNVQLHSFPNPNVDESEAARLRLASLPDGSLAVGGRINGSFDLGGGYLFPGADPHDQHGLLAKFPSAIDVPSLVRTYNLSPANGPLWADVAVNDDPAAEVLYLGGSFSGTLTPQAGSALNSQDDYDPFVFAYSPGN
jgi:hypothetical protein